METPVITKETFVFMREAQAELGRQYHPDFVSILACSAEETLADWLEANNAPEQARDLFQNCVMLERYVVDLRHGNMSEIDASNLVDIIPEVTQQIAALGGTFEGGGSISNQDPIEWPVPQDQAK